MGDYQARFRENVRVKIPCVTRLAVILRGHNIQRSSQEQQQDYDIRQSDL